MRHSSARELFDYWNALRGNRAAPDRSEIEPGAIRRALADTFILAFDAPAGHPFRIAGTRVCAAFGRELKGSGFADLWGPASRQLLLDLVTVVTYEGVGVVAGARATNADNAALDLELLILPLGHRGRTEGRIVGVLAPVKVPYWLGTSTLGALTLGSHRYLGDAITRTASPRTAPSLPNGRARSGLVVYDGGQS